MKVHILFAKNISWWNLFGRLIMWIEKRRCSHTAILVDYYGTYWVYESIWPVGRKVKIDSWLKRYRMTDVFTLSISDEQKSAGLGQLQTLSKRPYSIFQLLWIGLGIIFKPFDKWSNWHILNAHKAMICTELVAEFLIVQYGVKFPMSPDMVGINDLEKELLKMDGVHVWRDQV